MGQLSRIRGSRRSARCTPPAERRAALQPPAAATQGKGDAPRVPRRCDLRDLESLFGQQVQRIRLDRKLERKLKKALPADS